MKSNKHFPEYEGYIYRIDSFIKDGSRENTVFATIDKKDYGNYKLLGGLIPNNRRTLSKARDLLEEKIQMRLFPMFLDSSLVNCLVKVYNEDRLLPVSVGRVYVPSYILEVKNGPKRGFRYIYFKQ